MESTPNKADVESRLHQTAEAMSQRMASIQEEVSSTGVSIRDWIVQNPMKSVGGMLAAGLAVGVFFGGSRSRRREEHAALVDTYLDALREEAETAVEKGEEPGPALEKALRDRVPLVVYNRQRENGAKRGGLGRHLFREVAEILSTT